jgi:hypothetical protein
MGIAHSFLASRTMRHGLFVVLLFTTAARADELHLKDGRVLEGRVLCRKNGQIDFRLVGGAVSFPESQVVRVVPKRCVFDEYDERAAALAPTDLAGRVEFARWCEDRGLTAERTAQLRGCLVVDPDYADARSLLGETKLNGKWMTRESALRALGYVKHEGKWLNPEDAARLVAAEHAEKRRAALQKRFDELVRAMYLGPEAKAVKARDDLAAFAEQNRIPGLRDYLPTLEKEARAFRTATLEVRLQNSKLVALNPRRLSLGAGSQVTLELPETQTTKAATTVIAPVR